MPRSTCAAFRLRPIAAAAAVLLLGAAPAARAQNADAPGAATTVLPKVEIVGTTPIPGVGVPIDRIPANVQNFNNARLKESGALNLPELMSRSAAGTAVTELQGNPYQVEVNFRGFSASPLLGTPQGVSVFLDGVRVNEPFGDIVNWDLIPRNALRSVTVMPGANPVFGLNTLGGALVLATKSGDVDDDTEIELSAGSWKRLGLEVSQGLRLGGGMHAFIAASAQREDGWRDASPSRVAQVFTKFGQKDGAWSYDLSLAVARNRLIGNGPLPDTMLAQRYAQVYTTPDITRNRMGMLTFNGGYALNTQDKLNATAYLRRLNVNTVNGDLNDEFDPPAVPESGVENRTETRQRGLGLGLQWSRSLDDLQLVVGLAHDRATSDFEQTEAAGNLDDQRGVVVSGDEELNAAIEGRSHTNSLYAASTWSLRPDLHLSLSGRYNRTQVRTVDVGRAEQGLATALDNDVTYSKFNPALGVSWQAAPALTAYASVGQGNRAPSPIELGCSDPANACVLPNALQSDPPLKQVVSRTFEAGLRGSFDDGLRWNASFFRTQNRDDILWVSNSLAAGYFTNFGKTLRQGLELGTSGRVEDFSWAASYSLVRATYQSSACVVSGSNSTAETAPACTGEEEIEVRPGDRLPGVPLHSLKLDAGWRVMSGVRVGANVVAQSGVYVRGNENNRHEPDGADFNGAGRTGGFAVLNLNATWRLQRGWTLGAKVTNVFNRKYATGGLLGRNAFDADNQLQAPADWRNERFVAPGAPRGFFLSLNIVLDDD